MSLESLIHQRLGAGGRIDRRPSKAEAQTIRKGAEPTVVEQLGALPNGSMRVLEAVVAASAILTAVLIGLPR